MNISFVSLSYPFPKLKIDNCKTEFEIFSTNFRGMDFEPIVKAIQNKPEIDKKVNISRILRLIGNESFKACKYRDAFYFYCSSIGIAPPDSVEYALAIANRSAVFFALEKYKECLKDIEHVLKLNYPQNKLNKIYIRQTECLLKLKQNFDALRAWAKASNEINKFKGVDLQQIASLQNRIEHVIRTAQIFNFPMRENEYPKPSLKNGKNKEFLNASDVVELKSNKTKGRYVIAKNDIKQGDILFVEEPYSAVSFSHSVTNHVYCSYCLIFSANNIPCKYCSVHFYCSDECRTSAWTKSHKWECFGERKQLLSCNIRLILNIIFEASRHNFDTTAKDDSKYGNKKNNFAFVDKLVSNKSQMNDKEICVFTQYAIFLVIYLRECTDYFVWLKSQPMYAEKSLSDLYELIGGHILKLTMQIYCNYDEIVDADLHDDGSPDLISSIIGRGLYVSSAMVNHSCAPNALASFDKKLKIIRAIKNIPRNSEVTVNYEEYREEINDATNENEYFVHYKFNCNCSKCGIKIEQTAWLCPRCHGKVFNMENEIYGQCLDPACKQIINIREFRDIELIIAPNLLAGLFTLNHRCVEKMFSLMQHVYHKDNIKFVGYYLAAYTLYMEKRDIKKCVEVTRSFVEFTEKFDEINDYKIQANLRHTAVLLLHYVFLKMRQDPGENDILCELHSSLIKTKKLLVYYVPPMVITNYEQHICKFLDGLVQNPHNSFN